MQNKLLTLGVISLTALGLAGCSTQKQSSPKNNNQIKPTKVVKKKLSKKQQAKIIKDAVESNKQAKKESKNQPDEQVRKSDANQKTPAKKKGPVVDTSQQTQYTKKAQQQGPLADPSKAATTVVEHPHSNNSMQMEQKTSNRNPNTSTIYNDPTSYPKGQFK